MTLGLTVDLLESPHEDAVLLRSTGRFDARDVVAANRRIGALPEVRSGAPILNDARAVDFSVEAGEIVRAARTLQLKSEEFPENRVALVVSGDRAFGFMRMYVAYRRAENLRGVFFTIPSALEWLNLPEGLAEVYDC